jgi:hypothetical protein
MSNLDRHIGTVRTRMAIGVFLWALAWALIVLAVVVWAAILIDRAVQVRLPRQTIWFWSGLGIAFAAALAFTLWRLPTRRRAAIAIDERLALKEKFSTALYMRPSRDPFAVAAVRDAEQTADRVNLQKKFPVQLPMAGLGTVIAMILVFLTAWLAPTLDLFGVQANRLAKTEAAKAQQRQAQDVVRQAIAQLESAPKDIANKQQIKIALNELKDLRGKPTIDPDRARSTAQKAVQDVQQAIKDKIEKNKSYAVSQEEMREFNNLTPPADEPGAVADAHRDLAKGNLDHAVDDLAKAVNGFDKMSKKDQEKTTQQMNALAKAVQKMAENPKVQQQINTQLQKMGASQQQAQQMSKLMQQAANGSPQAAQQLQQIAKQLAQQANQNGKGSAQQQRQAAQQIQKAVQAMQQQANAQASAQQLAQAAQALAQAMKQSAQGNQAGQPKQGGNPAPKAQPGQQMANAAKQMQQQLQQMQAVASDAQQVAAAQQNAGQDADGQNPGQNGQKGKNGNGQQPGNGNGPGPWGPGNNPQQGLAQGGGPGRGAGNNRPTPVVAPYQVKDETDIHQRDEKGKVLASNFVKAGSVKGEAKMEMHKILPSIDKEATDEVDEQRISRQDRDAVRGYFDTLEKDTEK